MTPLLRAAKVAASLWWLGYLLTALAITAALYTREPALWQAASLGIVASLILGVADDFDGDTEGWAVAGIVAFIACAVGAGVGAVVGWVL